MPRHPVFLCPHDCCTLWAKLTQKDKNRTMRYR